MSALFGILQLDRGEPFGYANLAGLVQAWLQDAGGFAAIGLIIYLLYAMSVPTDKSQSERLRVPVSSWMVAMLVLSLVCYGGVLALLIMGKGAPPEPPVPPLGSIQKVEPPVFRGYGTLRPFLLMIAGLFALLGICEPFVKDLIKVRGRRIWALARLSFKEAMRYRILWVLIALTVLPYLFRSILMSNTRPADEFRVMILGTSLWLTLLVLIVGVIIAAISIPNDIKSQTIHTVVTKPVERFEIVLGRFLGYAGLMTLTLIAMTAVSLVFINTANVDEKAQKESATARVPIRGRLEFASRKADFDGTNVGREFDYRRYIAGHPDSPQRAIWHFYEIPAAMKTAAGDAVPVEFTFDIYKLTKGVENEGVGVTFRVVTHQSPQAAPKLDQRGEWQWADKPGEERGRGEDRRKAYESDLNALPKGTANARPGTPGWTNLNELAQKHGYFELRGKEVFDYAVGRIEIPAGLFRNAAEGDPGIEEGRDGVRRPRPRLSIYVKCESPGQLLGMAEPDLYLLEANQPFSTNFVKGMVGLWCRLCIVIGLAIACSTYLSGVLSLLITAMIFLFGYGTDHLNDLARNRNVGGGPFQTISQLMRAESPTTPFGDSSSAKVVLLADRGWAWVVRRIVNVIPDVESFTWTHFVSEGFNVNIEFLVINVLMVIGYLFPWFVLAYYLMKSREVAN
jgi:hypothetical protein